MHYGCSLQLQAFCWQMVHKWDWDRWGSIIVGSLKEPLRSNASKLSFTNDTYGVQIVTKTWWMSAYHLHTEIGAQSLLFNRMRQLPSMASLKTILTPWVVKQPQSEISTWPKHCSSTCYINNLDCNVPLFLYTFPLINNLYQHKVV